VIGLLIIILILLALFGMPLFAVLGTIAVVLFWQADIDISSVAVSMYTLAGSPLLVAIPLFTFAGYLFAYSNAPERLVKLSRALFPGGLAVVALVACAVFTAFTGASGVTIIAMGGMLLPALTQEGYDRKFNLGLLTAAGSLGLLFPPILPLIIYGYVAAVSIDQLFLAGLLPGIFLVVVLALYGLWRGRRGGVVRERPLAARRADSPARGGLGNSAAYHGTGRHLRRFDHGHGSSGPDRCLRAHRRGLHLP